MLLWVFFPDSFERDSWNDRECSCVNSYLKFRFELTGYYNKNVETRCFSLRLYSTDCWFI